MRGGLRRLPAYMSQSELPPTLMPSIMDRLLDPGSIGTKAQPGYSLPQVLESVRLDLEELLNTSRAMPVHESKFRELAKSVATYGLTDLTSIGGSTPAKQEEIGRMIEKAIAL